MILAIAVETIRKHFNINSKESLEDWQKNQAYHADSQFDHYEVSWTLSKEYNNLASTLTVTRLGMASLPTNKEGWSW